MIEESFVFLAISGAIIAGITDARKGIIPNKLTFPLILIGISGHLFYSIYLGTLEPLKTCLKSFFFVFAFGYFFWLIGGWSAGDVKEFLFIAALVPKYPSFLKNFFNPHLGPYPFAISVLVNAFLSVLPFIVIYSIIKIKLGILGSLNIKKYLIGSLVLVASIVVSQLAGFSLLALPILLLFYKIEEKKRTLIAVSILGFYSLYRIDFVALYLATTFPILVGMGILWNSAKIFREKALTKEVMVSELKEGMVLDEEIYTEEGKVIREKKSLVQKIKKAISEKELKRKGMGTAAAGLTKDEAELLKRLGREGKLKDPVKIKKTMPFAPSIAFGLLISLIFGDLSILLWEGVHG